ncbi:hypothetical protein [Lutispora sp.]|uniref:hypothetical protein n=1 Tax=Lutispora sp. TaxID=2828727 RepID=UPI00356751C3
MKRIVLIIIIFLLILVGCNDITTQKQLDTSIETIEQQGQSNSSYNIETYQDETHKEIQYGKLSFGLDLYHIVSYIRSDNEVTFKLEIDEGKVRPKTQMTIIIKEIEKQNFNNNDSTVEYLSNMFQAYETISIYTDIKDVSGITDLYSVTGQGMTKYIVCYNDTWYLIESDYNKLKHMLFENRQKANYEINNHQIECTNSFTAYVKETILSDYNKVKYEIIQGKDETKYYAELSLDKEYQFKFVLNNEKGENLLTLSTRSSDFHDVVKFIDVNMDGYVDVRFLEISGTMNNNYKLYVWDNLTNGFTKVKYDEILSYFEVYDGYLLNWQKKDAQSGIIQKLIWEGNTLVKESEELYEIN